MSKLMRKLLRIAAVRSSKVVDCCSLQGDGGDACVLLRDGSPAHYKAEAKKKKMKVPKGCVPVIVNGEHRLFFTASRLSHPLLTCLLQQTAQEMDYSWHYPGPLQLSCDPASFHHLLRLATPGRPYLTQS